MTATLDSMISDLAWGILEAAQDAPVDVHRLSARLPIEFALQQGAAGHFLTAQPPEDIQARDLSTPVGQFDFTLEIESGGGHG